MLYNQDTVFNLSLSDGTCTKEKCVATCEEGWEKHGDHCYHWVTEKMNWTNAEEFCQKKTGHLASVASNETMGFVLLGAHSRNLKYIWLGGNDVEQEGVWKWTDCIPWDLELWGTTGQPDNAGGRALPDYLGPWHRVERLDLQ